MTLFDTTKRAFPLLLMFAYGLFTCGYFFLENYSSHYRLFARFVFLLGLFVFVGGIRENYKHPLFQIIVLYIAYLLLSGFWQAPVDWFRLGQKLTLSIYILSFITITYFLVNWNRVWFERMLQLCILIAAISALVSIVIFYRDNEFPGARLVGIGTLTNVNEFTNVYGAFSLLAMGFALRTRLVPCRLLLFLAIAIFISYAWFGQSRTAFVSMIFILGFQAVMTLEKKRSFYTTIIALLVFGTVLTVVFPDTIEQAFHRGMGLRPLIWEATWSEARLAPIFGHGITSNISVRVGKLMVETTHNAYLQAFWHGGVVGLGLLLLLLLFALRQALSLGRRGGDYTVFCMLLFAACTMMTGVDALIDRPRDQWMLFWLPLALLLSYQTLAPRNRPGFNSNGVEPTAALIMNTSSTEKPAARIAVLLPSLEGGGAERSMLTLISAFLARGRTVDLVLCQAKGSYLGEVPEGATMIELKPTGGLRTRCLAAMVSLRDFFALLRPVLLASKIAPEIARLRSLQQYIEDSRPDVILSALPYANLVAIWAQRQSEYQPPVIVSERIALATYCAAPSNSRKWRWRYLPELVRRTYPGADKVVAVSNYVADELTTVVGLRKETVTTIYNPVVDDTLRERAQERLEHPWFTPDAAPVILGVGRLTEQKDFATLIRAFALIREDREARLVILGEGRLRQDLDALATRLGIRDDVDMPGFVANPLQYMARASALVLSSEYEGLPGVLIQAIACGCPVVSTNCPGGSAEILADQKYGALVDIGDADAIAKAVLAELNNPISRDLLLHRAEDFTVERAVDTFLELLDSSAADAAAR